MNTLYFDIENSPILGHSWGMYEQNLLSIVKDTELLSFAWKVNDGPVSVVSRRLYTEKQLVKMLWKLFDEADVLVAHNGDSFDIKMANQYFIKYKLRPPAPYKSIDTKKLAKKSFRFSQNKLDYLGQFLFQEGKISTNFDLWARCMRGDEKALREMERYNKQDVVLLYRVHKELQGWSNTQVNRNMFNGTSHACPHCGGATQKRGFAFTRTSKYQRYQCIGECHGWSQGESIKLPTKVIR